jgi:hypothetical protein
MMLPLHPTVRAEVAIGAAVFLTGAAVGVLVEAVEQLRRARRAEREQLRGAGALVDELERDRDELRTQVNALGGRLARAEVARDQLRDAIDEHRGEPGSIVEPRDVALYAAAFPPRVLVSEKRCACVRGAELCDDCRPPAATS